MCFVSRHRRIRKLQCIRDEKHRGQLWQVVRIWQTKPKRNPLCLSGVSSCIQYCDNKNIVPYRLSPPLLFLLSWHLLPNTKTERGHIKDCVAVQTNNVLRSHVDAALFFCWKKPRICVLLMFRSCSPTIHGCFPQSVCGWSWHQSGQM